MAFGSVTVACLMLAVGAGAPETYHVNTTRFQIPIRIQPERRAEIRELVLYVSTNQGQSWEMASRATPDKEAFPFIARGDGSYWFCVAIIDQKGNQEPRDIMQAPVGQRIVIDTVKPEVRALTGERQGDGVVVRWDLREDNPDFATLKLEYRTADMAAGSWVPVPVPPALSGEATIRPTNSGTVSLRMQLHDLAGNVGQGQAEIPGAMTTAAYTPPPPVGPTPPAGGNVSPGAPQQPVQTTTHSPTRPSDLPEAMVPSPGSSVLPPPGPPPSVSGGGQVLATTPQPGPGTGAPGSPAVPSPMPTATHGPLPPVQIVNKRKVSLDFEVAKFGPSGLGAVEVYATLDDGRTWERAPIDANAALPLSTDSHSGGPVRGSVAVQLTKEGTAYGFFVVVKSRAGLGRPAPQSGDLPQIRVEVDTTPPEAELYAPKPDPTKRDTLILTWSASDRNLATNPITLEWAERREGPWSFIGPEALPHTGKYAWQVPANVPPSVFLRLTVRDVAGNTAVAQTSEPVLVDFNVPEVNVIGLGASSR